MSQKKIDRREIIRLSGGFLAASSISNVSGCLGSGAKKEVTVDMTDDLNFEPKEVKVKQGGTVTWKNVGKVGHTVTAYENQIPEGADFFASGGFSSEQEARQNLDAGIIGENGTYEHTFETKGTYEYFCIPHESSMRGTIEVV